MFGFVFGTACLFALGAMVSHGGHRRRRWRRFGAGPLYGALARLGTTPGQEKAIKSAVDEFWEVARKGRGTLESTRSAAAQAVSGAQFDESSLRQSFVEQDAALAEIREALITAGRKIHEALDERQRKILAELIEDGPGFGRMGHFGHHGCGHHGCGHHHHYC